MDSKPLLLFLSLWTIGGTFDCSKIPEFFPDAATTKRIGPFVSPEWKVENETVVCKDGYMIYILHCNTSGFLLNDTALKCSVDEATQEANWRSTDTGFKLHSVDVVTCKEGHVKDKSGCMLSMEGKRVHVIDQYFRCHEGNITVLLPRKKEIHLPELKCVGSEWFLGKKAHNEEAISVECRGIPTTTTSLAPTTKVIHCKFPSYNLSLVSPIYPKFAKPIVVKGKLTCPEAMKFHIILNGKKTGETRDDEFYCNSYGKYVSATSNFSIGEKDMVICVDTSVVLPSTEEITTSTGCRVGIAKDDFIPGNLSSFVIPINEKEEIQCPTGYILYVTREGEFGYIVENSLVCSEEKSFETKESRFPLDLKDSIACLPIDTAQFNACEVFVDGLSVHVINEIRCPSNHSLRILDKIDLPEGKGLACTDGVLSDCAVNHRAPPTIQCVPRQPHSRSTHQYPKCSSTPSFTASTRLPAPFKWSSDPIVTNQTEIACSKGKSLLISRTNNFDSSNIDFLIKDNLHCSRNIWETPWGHYRLHPEDTITCVAVNITEHEPCELHLDGQQIFLVNEIACPDRTTLALDSMEYKQGQSITCRNSVLGICDATIVHRNPEFKCVPNTELPPSRTESEEKGTPSAPLLNHLEYSTSVESTTATLEIAKSTPKRTTSTSKPITTQTKPTTTTTTTPAPTTTTTTPVPTTTPSPTTKTLVDQSLPDNLLAEFELRQSLCNTEKGYPFPSPSYYTPCSAPYVSTNENYMENCRRCVKMLRVCGRALKNTEAYKEAKKICPTEEGNLAPIYRAAHNIQTWNDNGTPIHGYVSRKEGACGATVKVHIQMVGKNETYYIWK